MSHLLVITMYKTEHQLLDLLSTVSNKKSNKLFIGLRWSTINRLLDSIFDEKFVLLKKIQFENLLVKNREKYFEKISIFLNYLPGPATGICTADDKFVIELFLVQ